MLPRVPSRNRTLVDPLKVVLSRTLGFADRPE